MTFNLLILFSFYFLIIFSVIGYGSFFCKILSGNNNINFGFKGLYGLFLLIVYSSLSHYFFAHSILHNSLILIFGLFLFIFIFKDRLDDFYGKTLLLIFLILFVALLIFKTHDDFPYYHFGYSYYLTQEPLLIGVGQFNHGFRTPSSIFYLNSLYFLPFIEHYSFYIPTLLFLGFSNFILFSNLHKNIKEKKLDYLFFLNILILIFINIFFYRLQEHGTDRSAQILISVLFIEILYLITYLKNFKKHISNIFILLGIIISLKAFYVLYLLLFIPLTIILYKYKKFNLVTYSLNNLYFFAFSFLLLIVISIYLFNTGCLLYPLSFTCFDNFDWSIGVENTAKMNEHYQLWSKAGKTPNSNVLDPENYLMNFNWIPNWIDLYFFNKVSDFLLGLFVVNLIVFIFFFKKNKIKFIFDQKIKSILTLYFFIFILLVEWFINHPALRYGGYILIALITFIPISLILEKNQKKYSNSIFKFKILISITILVFIMRNFDRINNEINKYDYNPLQNSFYYVDKSHFRIQKNFDYLITNFDNCKVNLNTCDTILSKKVKEFSPGRYMFVYD